MLRNLFKRDIETPVEPAVNSDLDLELVQGYLIPWVLDHQESDGQRSYNVYHHTKELQRLNIDPRKIEVACTAAANIIRQAFEEG